MTNVLTPAESTAAADGVVHDPALEAPSVLPTALMTQRLTLVAPDLALAQRLAHALNASYELHRDFLVWSKPHWALEDAQETLDRARDDFPSATAEKKYFLVQRGDAQEVVGCIGVSPANGADHAFELGYWANQRHARKGLMKEALTALVSRLSGYTLRLTCSSANIGSQRLAQAAGFELIETLAQARTSGRFGVCDTLVYQRAAR